MRNTAYKNVYKGVTPYKVQKLTRRKGKGAPELLIEGPPVETLRVVFFLSFLLSGSLVLSCKLSYLPPVFTTLPFITNNLNNRGLVFTILDARRLRSEPGGSQLSSFVYLKIYCMYSIQRIYFLPLLVSLSALNSW